VMDSVDHSTLLHQLKVSCFDCRVLVYSNGVAHLVRVTASVHSRLLVLDSYLLYNHYSMVSRKVQC